MVKVEIFTTEWDPEAERFSEAVISTLTVDGSRLASEGDPDWGGFEQMVVIGPGRRELRFPEDGEEWARNLPRAFRNQLQARVIVDTEVDRPKRVAPSRLEPALAMASLTQIPAPGRRQR